MISKQDIRGTLQQFAAHPELTSANLFGIGMVRWALPVGMLHVFDETFMEPGVSEAHNHSAGFESRVIAGEVRQHRYYTTKQPNALAVEYVKRPFSCIAGGLYDERVTLWTGPEERYREGETYGMLAAEIHRSYPVRGTVTLVSTRGPWDKTQDTFAYFEVGTPYKPIGSRTPTPDEVRAIIGYSLEVWF